MILVLTSLSTQVTVQAKGFGEHGGYDVATIEGTSATDRGSCFMREEFDGPGESRLTLGRSLDKPDIVWMIVDNQNWSTKDGVDYEGVRFDFDNGFYDREARGTVERLYHGLISGFPAAGLLQTFAKAKRLYVYRDGKIFDQLNLEGSALAEAAFDKCWVYLVADDRAKSRERNRWNHIPRDPFATETEVAPVGEARARAQGSLAGLFSSDDYPQTALRNEEQGVVGLSLGIGPDGRVSSCSISSSSGSISARCYNLLRQTL
jgi:hypothetical protein